MILDYSSIVKPRFAKEQEDNIIMSPLLIHLSFSNSQLRNL
jgi:hypothetical protein